VRKSIIGIVFTILMMIPCHSFGYITYLEIDSTVQIDLIGGIQFDVLGVDIDALTLQPFYTTDIVDIDGDQRPGAAPYLAPGYPWSFETTNTNGILSWDNSYGVYPLSQGVILSLESSTSEAFTLDNFILASSYFSDGFYAEPYIVKTLSLPSGEASVYSITTPVPSSLFLLGGGLLGFLAFRRKQK
jgi:hypothetical protein